MAKVIEITITGSKGNKMESVEQVGALLGKGLLNDRKFKSNNDKSKQLTIIEIEKINIFNEKNLSNIAAIDFRRNIITQGIELNNLLKKEFLIGSVKVKAHDYCEPCKYLQDYLKEKNLVKELLHSGGLRCEILSSGKICIGDLIKY